MDEFIRFVCADDDDDGDGGGGGAHRWYLHSLALTTDSADCSIKVTVVVVVVVSSTFLPPCISFTSLDCLNQVWKCFVISLYSRALTNYVCARRH